MSGAESIGGLHPAASRMVHEMDPVCDEFVAQVATIPGICARREGVQNNPEPVSGGCLAGTGAVESGYVCGIGWVEHRYQLRSGRSNLEIPSRVK